MDTFPPDYILGVAKGFLPEPVLSFLDDHVLAPESYFRVLVANALQFLCGLWDLCLPLIEPLVESLTDFIRDSPNIVGAAAVIVLAVLALRVVSLVQRFVMFWTRLAFKAMWWAFVAALVALAYQRGIDETVADVVNISGKIVSGVMRVADIWITQYMAASEAQNKGARR